MPAIVRKRLQDVNPCTIAIKYHCIEEGNVEHCCQKQNKLAFMRLLRKTNTRQKTSDKIGGQVEDNLSKFNHIS